MFRHCCIVGLGLLGGSLALDLRRRFPDLILTGIARRQETRDAASLLGQQDSPVFTHLSDDMADVRDADLVVLCTPVQTIITQLAEIAPFLAPGTVVTDVGSTKRTVLSAATLALPAGVFFVGGHPMAGSDRAGLAYARPDLYRGATWALCALPGAEQAAERLAAVVLAIGARPAPMDADVHDEIVALTSHLPHIIAAALANLALSSAHGDDVLPFIAGGFRDTTRIAAANPVLWRDICLTNRERLVAALDGYLAELARWREALAGGDAPLLEALLTNAQYRRERVTPPAETTR